MPDNRAKPHGFMRQVTIFSIILIITPFIGDIAIYQHSLFGDYEACPCYIVLAGHAHEDL